MSLCGGVIYQTESRIVSEMMRLRKQLLLINIYDEGVSEITQGSVKLMQGFQQNEPDRHKTLLVIYCCCTIVVVIV